MRLPFSVPAASVHQFDLVAFGENSIDIVAVVAGHPSPNSKLPLESFSRMPGGQVATAAAVCARLGRRTRYVGSFGNDDLAWLGLQSLTSEGVNVDACWNVPGATSRFALVLVDASNGERTVLWSRHELLGVAPGRVPADVATSGRMLLVDGSELPAATELARTARAAGIPVVADLDQVVPGTEGLLEHVDALIASQAFPSALTGYAEPGRALAALAERFGTPLVVSTLGDEGSLALCEGREHRTAAFPVDCIDSTGAGDAFHGGFVAACTADQAVSLEDALTYANAVASLNCRALGARGGMPTAADVRALLMAHPRT